MKRLIMSLIFMTVVTYLLAGLQANLHFLPFSVPALWVVVFCYVSFYRNIFTAMLFNLLLAAILVQYSSVPIAPLLVTLNVLTLTAKLIQDRFNLNDGQILLSIGLFCLGINIGLVTLENGFSNFYVPHFWAWVGQAIATAAVSPFIFYPVLKIDQYVHAEPTDHLEQLFV